MIDAQPGDDGWIVPAAVTWALFEDPKAAEEAMAATEPLTSGNGHARAERHGNRESMAAGSTRRAG